MTLIERSWMILTSFFIALSSIKIQKVTHHHGTIKGHIEGHVKLELPSSGALAMAMSFSMPMAMPPMGMPMPMPPVGVPVPMPYPVPIKIPVIDFGGRPAAATPSPTHPNPQQNAPGTCRCNINQQQVHQGGCPPCPFSPHQQHPQQQFPQQQFPQQQHQQCCQNNIGFQQPPNMPCNSPNQACNKQCVVCAPGGQRPGPMVPGQNNMVPVAQVVLSPYKNDKKYSSGESSDEDSDENESDDSKSDGCSTKCRRKLARMNAERRFRGKHRRMYKRKYSKKELLNLEDNSIERSPTEGPIRPILQYVAKNGDVKYKTKLSNDEALELLGDNLVTGDRTISADANTRSDGDLLKNNQYNARKIFPNNQPTIEQPNSSPVRLMRAGDPIMLRNKVQHQIINPGKKELVFQSPKGNEITNLSLTFLFS